MIKIISYVKLLQKCNMLENVKDTLEIENAHLRASLNQANHENKELKKELKECAEKRREKARDLRIANRVIKELRNEKEKQA